MSARPSACPAGSTGGATTAGFLFIDLRDHYGLTQCVVEPDETAFAETDKARSEWVLTLTGPRGGAPG